jgi:hypothetical protein
MDSAYMYFGQYALIYLRLWMLLPLTGALERATRVPPTISHASPHRVRKGGDNHGIRSAAPRAGSLN